MRRKKRFLQIFFMAIFMFILAMSGKVQVKAEECLSVWEENIGSHDYRQWSYTIGSYLVYDDSGKIMRIQEGCETLGDEIWVLIEYYDTNYNRLSQKAIAKELPIFGGFYETKDNYFILSGQTNPNESDSVEVFRITKYDKNWKRLNSVGLYGANTTGPFDAGNARMADDGEYLVIRTCHTMYKSSDGLNHQANVTIQLHMESMKITDYITEVANISNGYVSHSFNQFVEIDGGNVVAVDHGDAYPRSLVLIKYNSDVSSGILFDEEDYWEEQVNWKGFLEFKSPDELGYHYNFTGACVGAFEVTSSNYLVAGSYMEEDGENKIYERNIFVTSISKDLSKVKMNWITNYKDTYVTNPHMVPINKKEYLLMWETKDGLFYTKIDHTGNKVGSVYAMEGRLSDCKPVLISGKLVWYTSKEGEITFYEINCSDLSKHNIVKKTLGHQFQYKGASNGQVQMVCTECQNVKMVNIPDGMNVWWRMYDSNSSSTMDRHIIKVGQKMEFNCELFSSKNGSVDERYEIIVSNPKVIELTEDNCIVAKKDGIATVTIRPLHNKELSRETKFFVGKAGKEWLYNDNGVWLHYVNGETSDYIGLVKNEHGWWYVSEGAIDFGYTGLCKHNGSWFYVKNGKLDWNYTGLCKHNGNWFYVNKGVLNWNYTGLCKYGNRWYYVNKGVLNWNATGLCKHNGNWFYVKKGVVDFSYTGLVKHAGNWFYVKKGVLDWSYTGLCKYGGSWYYVKKGVLDWSYTGLCKYGGSWYYVKKGVLDWSYTGLCKHGGSWYYVKKGVLDWSYTGLCKHGGSWYYVKKGILDWSYTGRVSYRGRWYQVVKGVMK